MEQQLCDSQVLVGVFPWVHVLQSKHLPCAMAAEWEGMRELSTGWAGDRGSVVPKASWGEN